MFVSHMLCFPAAFVSTLAQALFGAPSIWIAEQYLFRPTSVTMVWNFFFFFFLMRQVIIWLLAFWWILILPALLVVFRHKFLDLFHAAKYWRTLPNWKTDWDHIYMKNVYIWDYFIQCLLINFITVIILIYYFAQAVSLTCVSIKLRQM